MFWQTENQIEDSTDLRQELRERLRLVAEFATLGAYELTGPAGHGDAPHAHDGEPTQRVFLFGRVPQTHCSHGREATPACPATIPERRIGRPARGSLRTRVPRRRAGVDPAQQPCTWAPAPAAPSRRER